MSPRHDRRSPRSSCAGPRSARRSAGPRADRSEASRNDGPGWIAACSAAAGAPGLDRAAPPDRALAPGRAPHRGQASPHAHPRRRGCTPSLDPAARRGAASRPQRTSAGLPRARARILCALVCALTGASLASGCRPRGEVSSEIDAAGRSGDALVISDALERRIDEGDVSEADREHAYEQAKGTTDDGSADYALARARLAGRLAEARGLRALGLVKEAESWALRSIERDPHARGGEARRMLGTLYVLAGPHTERGDSEAGLEMLETLDKEQPDDPRNPLRVAQALISLGDADAGIAPLCRALAGRDRLGGADRKLAAALADELGGEREMACPAAATP